MCLLFHSPVQVFGRLLLLGDLGGGGLVHEPDGAVGEHEAGGQLRLGREGLLERGGLGGAGGEEDGLPWGFGDEDGLAVEAWRRGKRRG